MRDVAPDILLVHEVEAARMLCISPRTLWTMAKAGTIPVVRIGRVKRYAVDDLKRWVELSKTPQEREGSK